MVYKLWITSPLALFILPVCCMERKKEIKPPPDTIAIKQTINGISYIGKNPKEVKTTINYGFLNLNAKDPIAFSTYKELLTENFKIGLPLVLCLTETKNDKGISIFRVYEAFNYLNNVLTKTYQQISFFDFFSKGVYPSLAYFEDIFSKQLLTSYPLLFLAWPKDLQALYLGKLFLGMPPDQEKKIKENLLVYMPYEYITVESKLHYIKKHLYLPIIKTLEPSLKQSQEKRRSVLERMRIALKTPDKLTDNIRTQILSIVNSALHILILYANQLHKNQVELIHSLILNNESKLKEGPPYFSDEIYLAQLLSTQPALRNKALKILDNILNYDPAADAAHFTKTQILWQKGTLTEKELQFIKNEDLKSILQACAEAIKGNYQQAIENLTTIANQFEKNIRWGEQTRKMMSQKNVYFDALISLAEVNLLQGNKKKAKDIIEKINTQYVNVPPPGIKRKYVEYLHPFPYLFYRAQKLWVELSK